MLRAKIILFIILFSVSSLYSQLEISVYTDKISYEYGEKIELKCKITNPADTTFQFFAGTHSSCQAEFSFNDFNSWEYTACLATTELLVFKPHNSKIYSWVIDPIEYGLPNNDGEQMIVGKYYFDLVDTIYINAQQYLGGQISVGYQKSNADSIQQIKDSLEIDVLFQSEFDGRIDEHWQVEGLQIDSIINRYEQDTIFNFIEKSVFVEYESIKDENPLNFYPLHVGNKWYYHITGNTYDIDIHPFEKDKIRHVLKDTVMNNGIKYFEIIETSENESRPTYVYERIDSTEMKVYTFNSSLEEINYDLLEYDFSKEIGDTICSNYEGLFKIYKAIYLKDTLMQVFDQLEYPISRLYSFWSFEEDLRILTPNFGLTRRRSAQDGYDDYWVLEAAFIQGKIYGDTTLVGISEYSYNPPSKFSLRQNYPNPFNPSTKIEYSIPQYGKQAVGVALNATTTIVTLKIYDILGREVSELVNKEQSPGEYEIIFDASNLGSGIYFYQLRATPIVGQAGSFVESKKMILLK